MSLFFSPRAISAAIWRSRSDSRFRFDGSSSCRAWPAIEVRDAIPDEHIKEEGQAGRLGVRLVTIVAEGQRGRAYLSATKDHEAIGGQGEPTWKPEVRQGSLYFRARAPIRYIICAASGVPPIGAPVFMSTVTMNWP